LNVQLFETLLEVKVILEAGRVSSRLTAVYARVSSADQRDDNAAINLARPASLGAAGAPVKHGAEHETGPRPAAGEDTRKGGSASAEPNNSVRSAA